MTAASPIVTPGSTTAFEPIQTFLPIKPNLHSWAA
jgi:hypothetical protein